MRCSKCSKLLVEFTEGRLENKQAQEIKKHIAGCAACRRELDEFQASLELVCGSMEKTPDTPADLAERVIDRVHRDANVHFPRRRLIVGIAAACCLLIFGAILSFNIREREHLTRNIRERGHLARNSAATGEMRVEIPGDAGKMPALPETKTHIGMELARLLGQTLEIIKRGEQEWEIEI